MRKREEGEELGTTMQNSKFLSPTVVVLLCAPDKVKKCAKHKQALCQKFGKCKEEGDACTLFLNNH